MNVNRLLNFVKLSGLAALLLFLAGCQSPMHGGMSLTVVDGMTDTPLVGASVVVPEAGVTAVTDEYGSAVLSNLPVIFDEQYDALSPAGSGRVTLIVYADGYVPYVLLYARVFPDRTREGMVILMFRDDGSIPVFSIAETPPLEWAAGIAEMYRP